MNYFFVYIIMVP